MFARKASERAETLVVTRYPMGWRFFFLGPTLALDIHIHMHMHNLGLDLDLDLDVGVTAGKLI